MDKVFLNKTKYCKDLYSILYEVLTGSDAISGSSLKRIWVTQKWRYLKNDILYLEGEEHLYETNVWISLLRGII